MTIDRPTETAAGGALTAKQAPRRSGTAPALGLRAGCDDRRNCSADRHPEQEIHALWITGQSSSKPATDRSRYGEGKAVPLYSSDWRRGGAPSGVRTATNGSAFGKQGAAANCAQLSRRANTRKRDDHEQEDIEADVGWG